MAAPKFLIDAWTSNGIFGSAEAVDRTTKRLQALGLVPRASKRGEALLLWEPTHHVNMLLSMILQDTSSKLLETIDMWKNAKLMRPLDFRSLEDNTLVSARAYAQTFDFKARNLLEQINNWEVDLLIKQENIAEAEKQLLKGFPSQIIPGETFGGALEGLIERFSSVENKEFYSRAQADDLAITLSWGSNQYAGVRISYNSSVDASNGLLTLVWQGTYETNKRVKAAPGVSHSLEFDSRLLMEMAYIWQETKYAREEQSKKRIG